MYLLVEIVCVGVGFLFENPYQAGVSLRGVVRFFSGFGVGF
jgi:hypothetical protein